MERDKRFLWLAIAAGIAAIAGVIISTSLQKDKPKPAAATATQATTQTSTGASTQPRTDTATTETTTGPVRPAPVKTITVRGGQPVGGAQRLRVTRGQTVEFRVRSVDVTDEVHVHGYDLKKELQPRRSVRFAFPATIEGIFDIELEGSQVQIAQLRVDP
jgi:heme/copper-type cytochrome/quinol oxidase subunit 2